MITKKQQIKFSAISIVAIIAVLTFQNCSEQALYLMSNSSSAFESSSQLPDESTLLPSKRTLMVQNKNYTASLFRAIFARDANDTGLENLINLWIYYRPAQFGGACNVYDTYGQSDCGGDVSNANLSVHNDPGTLREVYRLKLCAQVLNSDDFVNSALDKIGKRGQKPDAQSIGLLYSLFYREQDPSPSIIAALTELDNTLAANSENSIDRWRALLLSVCESVGWQLQ